MIFIDSIVKIFEKINSLKDLTKDLLKTFNKQLVIVEFRKNGYTLVFLVDDVEHPSVPGFPACSLEYFDDIKSARKEIENTYKRINHWPKNLCYKNIYR